MDMPKAPYIQETARYAHPVTRGLSPFAAAFLIILVLFPGCSKKGESSSPDDAVITVGGRSITSREYNDALKRLIPEDSGDISPEDLKGLKDEVANELIEEELLLQEARNLGIAVTDEEVASEAGRIKSFSDAESFREAVTVRYGSVEEWEDEIRKKLFIKKTVAKAVEVRVHITDEAARAYYDAHIREFDTPERVKARMIVVSNIEEAENLKKRLTPQNFAGMAKTRSLGPERANGGDLGYFSKGEMPKEFEDEVFRLKKGDISSIVKTEYGFHLFLLEDRVKAGRIKFKDVKDRIKDTLRQDAVDDEFEKWVSYLKENARIEIKEGLL